MKKKKIIIVCIFLLGIAYILLKNFWPLFSCNLSPSKKHTSEILYLKEVDSILVKFEEIINKTNEPFYLVFEDRLKEYYLKDKIMPKFEGNRLQGCKECLLEYVKGNKLKQKDLDKSLAAYKKALKLFKSKNDNLGIKISLSSIAEIHRMKRDSEKALSVFKQALKIDSKQNSLLNASVYRGMGKTYVHIGNFEQAEDFLSRSLSLFEESNEDNGIAAVHLDWAISKYYEGKYTESILNSLKAGNKFLTVVDPFGIAYVCINLSQIYSDLGHFSIANRLLNFSLRVFKKYADVRGEAIALKALGYIERLNGNFEIAESFYKEAIDLFKETNHLQGVGECMSGLGKIDLVNGNYKSAETKFKGVLEYFSSINHKWAMAYSLKFIGELYAAKGDFNKSEELYWRALGIFKSFKNSSGEASVYKKLGELFLDNEKYGEAQKYFLTASSLYNKEVNTRKKYSILLNLSHAEYKLGNIKDARKKYLEVLEYFSSDFLFEKGKAYYGLGKTYSYEGYQHKAREYFEKSLKAFNQINYQLGIARSTQFLGISEYRLGNYVPAKKYLLKSRDLFKKLENKRGLAETLCWLASTYFYLGETAEAIKILENVIKTVKHNKPKAMALTKLATILSLKGDYKQAELYYKEALRHFEKTKDNRWISILFKIMGSLYFYMDKHNEAETYFLKSINLGKMSGEHYEIYRTYLHLSELELVMDNMELGNEYINKALTSEFIKDNKKLSIETYIKMGKYKIRVSKYEEAERFLGHAYSLARETNNLYQEGFSLLYMGYVDLLQNKLERARYKLEHASRIFNKMELPHKTLRTKLWLIDLNFKLLHDKSSLSHYYSLLSYFNKSNDFHSKAWVLMGIGNVHHYHRNFEEALKSHKEAYKILTSIKSHIGLDTVLRKIARNLIKLKKYSEAEDYLVLSQNHAQKIKNNTLLVKTNIVFAYLYYKTGRCKEGISILKDTIPLCSYSKEEARCNMWLGAMYTKLGNYKLAQQFLEKSLITFSREEILWFEALNLKLLGKLYKAQGSNKEAFKYFSRARDIFKYTGNIIDEAFVLYEMYDLNNDETLPKQILILLNKKETQDLHVYFKKKLTR